MQRIRHAEGDKDEVVARDGFLERVPCRNAGCSAAKLLDLIN